MVSVIPAVGYDDPNQSHFTSRHYWEVGEINPLGRVGWMGRYLDRVGSPDNPLQGLSLDYNLAPGLAAGTVPVAAVATPESYRLWTRDVWNTDLNTRLNQRFGALGGLATGDGELAVARNAARQTIALQDQLAPLSTRSPAWEPSVGYPRGLVPAPARGAGRDARDGPAAALRRARRQRRLRHPRRPGRDAARRVRPVRALDRRLPGRSRSRAASPTAS